MPGCRSPELTSANAESAPRADGSRLRTRKPRLARPFDTERIPLCWSLRADHRHRCLATRGVRATTKATHMSFHQITQARTLSLALAAIGLLAVAASASSAGKVVKTRVKLNRVVQTESGDYRVKGRLHSPDERCTRRHHVFLQLANDRGPPFWIGRSHDRPGQILDQGASKRGGNLPREGQRQGKGR
jgi:hypothetical protein